MFLISLNSFAHSINFKVVGKDLSVYKILLIKHDFILRGKDINCYFLGVVCLVGGVICLFVVVVCFVFCLFCLFVVVVFCCVLLLLLLCFVVVVLFCFVLFFLCVFFFFFGGGGGLFLFFLFFFSSSFRYGHLVVPGIICLIKNIMKQSFFVKSVLNKTCCELRHPDSGGAGRSSEVERSLMVRCVVGSILHGADPLSYFSFHSVLHDWSNKGCSVCYPVCGMVHIKEPLLLIGKSSPCGCNGFPLSLSEWSFTICPTPYNRK